MNIKLMSNENLMKNIGNRICQERKTRHLTQEKLAQMAGVSVRTIRNLENAGNPTLDVLVSVFKAFDLTDCFFNLLPVTKKISPYERWKMKKKTLNEISQ